MSVARGQGADRLRIMVLAPDANPESVSVNLVCYRHAEALAQLHDVTLVTHVRNERAVRDAKGPFYGIEAVNMPLLDRIWDWSLSKIFKHNYNHRALAAFWYPFAVGFERNAWKRLRGRIVAGNFDVVLRLSPVNPIIPSPFPTFLRRCRVPFVIGPINGGLPWPKGFSQAANQKSGMDNLRALYRFLPFSRSTYRRAAAILAGSSHTFGEFAAYRDKLFFVPENGVTNDLCAGEIRSPAPHGKLELIFVGGLIPLKACDLAIRAAAPLLRNGLARFTIVGDGPERNRLEQLAKSLGAEEAVVFSGWLSHAEVLQRMRSSDVLLFPSVRDFGGGVVFEALAAGAVPVVADFGGPGDIVNAGVGCKFPLIDEHDAVQQMERILSDLAQNRDRLENLRQQGRIYARKRLTWDAKAQDVTRILRWVLAQGERPELVAPKALAFAAGSESSG
jgi:glycosyltransferase involved in cell wall biosynthesis